MVHLKIQKVLNSLLLVHIPSFLFVCDQSLILKVKTILNVTSSWRFLSCLECFRTSMTHLDALIGVCCSHQEHPSSHLCMKTLHWRGTSDRTTFKGRFLPLICENTLQLVEACWSEISLSLYCLSRLTTLLSFFFSSQSLLGKRVSSKS